MAAFNDVIPLVVHCMYGWNSLVSINTQVVVDEPLAFTETCLDTKFHISVGTKYTSSMKSTWKCITLAYIIVNNACINNSNEQ